MKRRKAPSEDGILPLAVQNLPPSIVSAMTDSVLLVGHFPGTWKFGKIIVFPKPDRDRRRPSSYRPITLLSHVGKLFEYRHHSIQANIDLEVFMHLCSRLYVATYYPP